MKTVKTATRYNIATTSTQPWLWLTFKLSIRHNNHANNINQLPWAGLPVLATNPCVMRGASGKLSRLFKALFKSATSRIDKLAICSTSRCIFSEATHASSVAGIGAGASLWRGNRSECFDMPSALSVSGTAFFSTFTTDALVSCVSVASFFVVTPFSFGAPESLGFVLSWTAFASFATAALALVPAALAIKNENKSRVNWSMFNRKNVCLHSQRLISTADRHLHATPKLRFQKIVKKVLVKTVLIIHTKLFSNADKLLSKFWILQCCGCKI